MKGTALFSECGRYRYWLTRTWNDKLPCCAFIGLNPSTADAEKDDPTIHKCIEYARSWEFGSLLMLNLFGFRAIKPAYLWALKARGGDHIGLGGNKIEHLPLYTVQFDAKKVIACWGKGQQEGRGRYVAETFAGRLDCLMKNEDGSPAHPLYLPYGLLPEPWNYQRK